jgi:hypothetical protein
MGYLSIELEDLLQVASVEGMALFSAVVAITTY